MDKEPVMRFEYENEEGTRISLVAMGALTWSEHLANLEQFLRGCGYYIDGHFDCVEEENE